MANDSIRCGPCVYLAGTDCGKDGDCGGGPWIEIGRDGERRLMRFGERMAEWKGIPAGCGPCVHLDEDDLKCRQGYVGGCDEGPYVVVGRKRKKVMRLADVA